MAAETPLFLLHIIGLAGFVWMGLYCVAQGQPGVVQRLTAITALSTALFFLYGCTQEALHDGPAYLWLAVDRLGWFCDVLPVALWVHLTLQLSPGRFAPAAYRRIVIALYSAAGVLVILGTATDLLRNYRSLLSDDPGPLYGCYTAFVLICTSFAVVNLAAMLRAGTQDNSGADSAGTMRASAVEARILVSGALCFLVGGGIETLRELFHTGWPETGAFLLLLAGMILIAAAIAGHGALLVGVDVRRDFLYSATGMSVLLLVFLLLAGGFVNFETAAHRWFTIAAAVAISSIYTLNDWARARLDGAFFSAPVREERAAARAYVEALATPPAGPNPEVGTRKQFDDALRRAITNISDPTRLAANPLLSLTCVLRAVQEQTVEDNRLNRAAALREILLDLLDGLKPADGSVVGDAARYYNCLYFPYVRGVSRRRAPSVLRQLQERRKQEGKPRSDLERVIEWLLQLDEDTFYKWQRRGSDTIAATLRERERACGGIVPVEIEVRRSAAPVLVQT